MNERIEHIRAAMRNTAELLGRVQQRTAMLHTGDPMALAGAAFDIAVMAAALGEAAELVKDAAATLRDVALDELEPEDE